MSKRKYEAHVKKELSCGDVVVASRRPGEAMWDVEIYRDGALVVGFELLSETGNISELVRLLRDLGGNTPPSYRG